MKTTETIAVIVDGQHHSVDGGGTLAELVSQLGHAPTDVATSVNGSFVARPSRELHRLEPGDSVLLFKPIVGG